MAYQSQRSGSGRFTSRTLRAGGLIPHDQRTLRPDRNRVALITGGSRAANLVEACRPLCRSEEVLSDEGRRRLTRAGLLLVRPARPSDAAPNVLGDAEDSDGIFASVASIGDRWYVSHKTGPSALLPGAFETIRRTLLDPETTFHAEPVLAATTEHFGRCPLPIFAIPFDRFIVATAAQMRVPLVSADQAIARTGLVEIIW